MCNSLQGCQSFIPCLHKKYFEKPSGKLSSVFTLTFLDPTELEIMLFVNSLGERPSKNFKLIFNYREIRYHIDLFSIFVRESKENLKFCKPIFRSSKLIISNFLLLFGTISCNLFLVCTFIMQDPTELRWYGRSEVIYEALEPLLYQQEGALMRELLPCLLSTLAVSERKQKGDGNSPGRPNRYDKVFQIILCNMEGEQKLALRREFAKFLPNLIKVMKITVLRHMKVSTTKKE